MRDGYGSVLLLSCATDTLSAIIALKMAIHRQRLGNTQVGIGWQRGCSLLVVVGGSVRSVGYRWSFLTSDGAERLRVRCIFPLITSCSRVGLGGSARCVVPSLTSGVVLEGSGCLRV